MTSKFPSARLFVDLLYPESIMPKRGTERSIGLDVHAYLLNEKGRANTMAIGPRTVRTVPTGIRVRVDDDNLGLYVFARSSMGKRGLIIANGPGLIDPDYRGELLILIANAGANTEMIAHGDRIAQLVLLPHIVLHPEVDAEAFDETPRGSAGFGSTGR